MAKGHTHKLHIMERLLEILRQNREDSSSGDEEEVPLLEGGSESEEGKAKLLH